MEAATVALLHSPDSAPPTVAATIGLGPAARRADAIAAAAPELRAGERPSAPRPDSLHGRGTRSTTARTETGFAPHGRNPVGERSRDAAAAGIARVPNQFDVDAAAASIAGVEEPSFTITAVHTREIFLREKPERFTVN